MPPMTKAQITAELTRKAQTPGSAAPSAANKAQYDAIVKRLSGAGGGDNSKTITTVPYDGSQQNSDMMNSDFYNGGGMSGPNNLGSGTVGTNGGTGTGGSGGQTVPGTGATTAAKPLSGFSYGDLLSGAESTKAQLDALMNTDFNYDYATDPSYLAAQTLARAGAKKATKNTMETMNDRGLLQSTMTNNQIASIEQDAELKPLELVPQLQAQALNQRNTQFQQLYNMFSGQLTAGMNSYQFEKTFPLQEAAQTGRYVPENVKSLIDSILGAKTSYADAKTKEERDAIAKTASDARAQLGNLGYTDVDKMFGGGVTIDKARGNVGQFGQLTASAQSALLGSLQAASQSTGFWPTNTGDMFNQMPLFQGLAPMFKGLEGKPTMEYQKFTQEMGLMGLRAAGEKLSQAATAQNQGYTAWLHQNNINEETAKQATNAFKTDILSMVGMKDKDGNLIDREVMMKTFAEQRDYIVKNGILVQDIIDAINSSALQPNKVEPPQPAGSQSPFVIK